MLNMFKRDSRHPCLSGLGLSLSEVAGASIPGLNTVIGG